MEESDHCTLCADGALEFAVRKGFDVEYVEGRSGESDSNGPKTLDLNDQPSDTVTAIAMDCKGNFACAASSGNNKAQINCE
jgi:isoaspartyl peptidase/L-asparaginase-like protein (Ntn-hydrolase superfamily)